MKAILRKELPKLFIKSIFFLTLLTTSGRSVFATSPESLDSVYEIFYRDFGVDCTLDERLSDYLRNLDDRTVAFNLHVDHTNRGIEPIYYYSLACPVEGGGDRRVIYYKNYEGELMYLRVSKAYFEIDPSSNFQFKGIQEDRFLENPRFNFSRSTVSTKEVYETGRRDDLEVYHQWHLDQPEFIRLELLFTILRGEKTTILEVE